jgi:hypothetical protein
MVLRAIDLLSAREAKPHYSTPLSELALMANPGHSNRDFSFSLTALK